MQWIGSRSTTRAGGRWDAHGRLPTRQSAALLILCSSLHHLPPSPSPCFRPHGIRVRGCSSHVGLDHDIDLGGSPSSTPVIFGAFHQTGGDFLLASNPRVTVCHTSYNITGTHESTHQDGSITLQSQRTDPHAFSYQDLKVCFGINGFRKGPHVVLDSADTLI
ncbi:unnamed protein product [Musa acuminata subsp. malaccensis]|uniref:(wild Malaysian banana) hypothetical protein n=1 Tax=Musa acuminata subsp. malaccensis TaxID=214687 RepID=A0A804JYG5_MUSAM|nr:unnamed protein product [Musa acuminata subsp. malaccensis]